MSEITAAWAPKTDWFHGQSETQLLDAFLTAQQAAWPDSKFIPLAEGWKRVRRDEVVNVLDHILARDLAYRIVQRDDGGVYEARAKEFLQVFGAEAAFFTNADASAFNWPSGTDTWSWTPATTSTFDLGVGAISAEYVGIYWAQSED